LIIGIAYLIAGFIYYRVRDTNEPAVPDVQPTSGIPVAR
jgi:hypothetical protein